MYAVIGGSKYRNIAGPPCNVGNSNWVDYGDYMVWKISGDPSSGSGLTLAPYKNFWP